MPLIEHDATIHAEPEAVFDLISRVESFVDLTRAVQHIEPLGDHCYRWQVRVAGIALKFEVEVTDIQPPHYFAWRSRTGVANRGHYTLTPTQNGTHLQFRLEYELRNRLLEKAISGSTRSIVTSLSSEIAENMEKALQA